MKGIAVFTGALGLKSPWFIEEIELREVEDGEELHITINHNRRTLFEYEGDKYGVYDHQERTWQHLDFFQHTCFIHARVPRIKLADGKVRLVAVPWAERGSSFTILFENKVVELAKNGMSVSKTGETLGISSKRAFRIINRRVAQALTDQPLETVEELSIDETSARKGHKYLTVLCDRERKKVVGISKGKDAEALYNALIDMEARGSHKQDVKTITMDMSKGYIAGVAENLPGAKIVFDRFHIMKLMNGVVDKIRREDQKNARQDFLRTRYYWLRAKESLKADQLDKIEQLSQSYPRIGLVYKLKESLRDIFSLASVDSRLKWINAWITEARKSKINALIEFTNTLHRHWYGIKTYFKLLATNAFAESVNLKIQEIKRSARGYRNSHNFMIMIYFHLGKLDLTKPTVNG